MKKPLFLITLILFLCSAVLAQDNKPNEKNKSPVSAQKDKPVKMLKNPEAAYPKSDTGTVCVQGTVTLKIQFLATGEIGEVQAVSGLPYGITENAIEAAKKIKFEAAVKGGKKITSVKTVIYNFTLY